MGFTSKLFTRVVLAAAGVLGASALVPTTAFAADHGDAPTVAHDQACDIGDAYFFLCPNDNTKVVMIATVRGFIAAGENVNFGIFDPAVRYRFAIENNGDTNLDTFIDVTFSQRVSTAAAQNATVVLPNGTRFTAPATNSALSATAPEQVITTEPTTGARFFAGMVDDPFFFDIPAFSRFNASVRAGTPDATQFNRGRDSFAGYNTMSIAVEVPISLLRRRRDTTTTNFGLVFLTQRKTQTPNVRGEFSVSGGFRTVDRAANPAVNVVLIPFARKNAFNAATPRDDARGAFVNDIVSVLTPFGTNEANVNLLASVAVTRGDILRLNTAIANSGPNGGNVAGAGFPNGRRLADDVVDTLLTIVANGSTLGDNVNASDPLPQSTFPFLAPPNQPLPAGTTDDRTRN